ncbi:MAG: AAA family ATPase [Sideroxydans sp.]|nr:AAA family ATPase [Sideroxydans sp.]
MKFTYFEIENFRGIQKTRLDLATIPSSHIYTLVGLNESGKSTILEAINHFTYKNETLDPLELPGYSIQDMHSLIPISRRSNFNEKTSVKFELELDADDEEKIANYMSSTHSISLTNKIDRITISRYVGFQDSKFDAKLRENLWTISLVGKVGNGRKGISISHITHSDIWQATVKHIMTLMPSVLYFPNFLFEFPDRIYLEDGDNKSQKSAFYRLVIQDILDATNTNSNLEKHILERAKSNDINDKKSLDVLLLEMGRNVTTVVFGAWNKIFHQNIGHKKILIKHGCDEQKKHYLEFKLEDTDGYFLINERSLGFRWFFVFLLLTQYRGSRKDSSNNVLFLFDEPASNLHPSAQMQLLSTFEKLAENCRIIYTTHSHHLINPEWLESAFVVKNDGLEYGDNEVNFNANKTDIKVTRYREFAVKHPDQTDYFRPILDVLDYVPSKFDAIPNVTMVEGKNDYYVISYMQFLLKKKINLMPGTSSSNLETPIRLYTAWGRQYLVLLDSDKEGIIQKNRYQELFEYTLRNRIFTLMDIDASWKNGEMEMLISDEDKISIQKKTYPTENKFSKKHFNRAIQELLITKTKFELSEETKQNFNALFTFIQTKFNENQGA